MSTELDRLLAQVPAPAREPVRALAEEGLSQLPQDLHAAWIDGAFQLAARGLNASVLLAYLRRDAGTTVPFWRMAGLPAGVLEARAGAILSALGARATALGALTTPVESLPGAGSLPGTVIPSFGIALDGDRTAELRSADPPVVARVREGRTYLDLRTVDPGDDTTLTKAMAALPPSRP